MATPSVSSNCVDATGFVPTDDFIPIAEHTGLIGPLMQAMAVDILDITGPPRPGYG
jgi:EAL domain-containing protein (putative c-di-GMP-specific phosphodiesterase class I)